MEKTYRYVVKKDGVTIREIDCVHLAKSVAEEKGAQLWRHIPARVEWSDRLGFGAVMGRSYLVTDYGIPV